MTGIFVSYSRKDSSIANKLIQEFKSIDLDVWVDWEDIPPAVGWLDQIFQGIERADAFVYLISPDSVASEVCKVELLHAHKNAKRIIPIVVRDVADTKQVEQFVRNLNWIFIRENDDLKVGLDKVRIAINIDVEWLQEHRRLHVRALEWDRKKDPSLLLRGSDLRSAGRMILAYEKKDPKPSDLQKVYINFSRRMERIRNVTFISAAIALVVTILLSVVAVTQRMEAERQRQQADSLRQLAEQQTVLAQKNEASAKINAEAAEKNAKIAKAQRSAARAQIYQSRTGGLFTSTLLAIASYKENPSDEAESILRKNNSLLPSPVGDLQLEGTILALEVSPDGTSFVATSEGGSTCFVRFEDGEQLFCRESSGSVLDAAFSPDGSIVATSDSTGEVLILDSRDGSVKKQFNLGVSVRDVNISPDGRLLAIARDDGKITIYKIPSYEFTAEFSVYGSLRVTAFSPDGEWFAAASNFGAITFWNLENGRIVTGATHRGDVFDIAFSPDSRRLISGGADNFAITIDPSSGRELVRIINEDNVTDVAFSPDNTWFVTVSSDFRIRVWDTDTGEEQLRFLQDSVISNVKISPNGLWIASTGSDQTARVWSASNGAEMFQIPLDNAGTELDFSPDGNYLITGDQNGQVSIWDISVLQTNAGYLRFEEFVDQLELSPDGEWFAASDGRRVWVQDPNLFATQTAPQGSPILQLDADRVFDMAISPDNGLLAVSTELGRIVLIDPTSRNVRDLVNSGPVKRIIFSADSEKLFLASSDGQIQFRNLKTGDAGVLWQGTSAVYTIAASAQNQLAVGMDNKIILLDIDSNFPEDALDAPGRNLLLQFAPDGNGLVSSSSSGNVYIWKKEGSAFTKQTDIVSGLVSSISFSSNGKRLFLGETDQILVIDPLTGEELNRIRQKGEVKAITIFPDGKSLLSTSLRTVKLFDLSIMPEITKEGIVAAACSRLTANFSPAEWNSFFEGEAYQLLCENLPVP